MATETPENTKSLEDFDDIFATSRSPSPSLPAPQKPETNPDLTKLHSIHSNSGYLAGITSSKALSVQPGFDESYPLGARIGERVGWILGVLSSLERMFPDDGELRKEAERARRECAREEVLSGKWWDGNGVWKWNVPGEEEGETTLEDVAEAWPVWTEWKGRVTEQARKRGVIVRYGGEEDGEGVGGAGEI